MKPVRLRTGGGAPAQADEELPGWAATLLGGEISREDEGTHG